MEALKWKPEPGRQGPALKAVGLKTADLRAAGFRWGRDQEWEAEDTPAAREVIARLTGQAPAPIEAPANDNTPAAVANRAPVATLAAIAKARGLAESLDAAAEAAERPREMNTPKRMAQAMHARLEAAVARRAAGLLRAWADNPDRLPTWKPHKEDARQAVRRKLQDVPNGWHSYKVEGSEPYPYTEPRILALRAAYPEALGNGQETQAQKIERLEAAVRFSPITGFFPTPPSLIRRVIELADIHEGHLVLEPSAGNGHLADAARQLGARVNCVEIAPRLREILAAKGHLLLEADDFLDVPVAGCYDRILANPPFERGQDRDHIRRMFDHLKPGGRLVSICSTGPFNRQAKADQEFRDWIGQIGGEVENVEPGAFAGSDAFRQTGVNVCIVTIDKE